MSDFTTTLKRALGLTPLPPFAPQQRKALTDELGRALPMGSAGAYAPQLTGAGATNWLGTNGPDLASSGYNNHGLAYSIVSYILSTAAPIPWGVYALDAKDNRANLLPKHPLADLLYRPNPQQSWADLKRQAQGGYQVNGEAFLRRVRPGAGSKRGKTAELWCLVGRVELLPLGTLGQFDVPTGYRHYDLLTGRATDYAADEVLHLKTWNPVNPHRGLSPIAAGIDAVTAAKAGLESRVRAYQNQGPPFMIFDEAAQEPWNAGQTNSVRNWFNSFFSGGRRFGEIPITGGKLGALKLGLSPVELEVLAAIPHDKDALCDLFHFPGQLLNGSKGTTYSNMGEAGAALYSRCVIPLETVMRDGLNRWLGGEYDDGAYLDFDVSHVPELQPNKEKLAAWLNTAWWIPVATRQRMLGVEVDWDGPKFVVPAGLMGSHELLTPPPGADVAATGGQAIN